MQFSKSGDPLDPNDMPVLAPGVLGYAIDSDDGIYVPLVIAEREGSGDVGRFLDSLPKDRRVVFPTVMSARLRAMLMHREFICGQEMSQEHGPVDIWSREPAT